MAETLEQVSQASFSSDVGFWLGKRRLQKTEIVNLTRRPVHGRLLRRYVQLHMPKCCERSSGADLTLDSMLAGVVLMQVIQYYQFCWGSDPAILKYLICWLLLVCVAFTGFHNQLTWHQYVYGFGTWSRFAELTCESTPAPLFLAASC